MLSDVTIQYLTVMVFATAYPTVEQYHFDPV